MFLVASEIRTFALTEILDIMQKKLWRESQTTFK